MLHPVYCELAKYRYWTNHHTYFSVLAEVYSAVGKTYIFASGVSKTMRRGAYYTCMIYIPAHYTGFRAVCKPNNKLSQQYCNEFLKNFSSGHVTCAGCGCFVILFVSCIPVLQSIYCSFTTYAMKNGWTKLHLTYKDMYWPMTTCTINPLYFALRSV